MRKLLMLLFCVVQTLAAMAQYNLLPAPRQLTERSGSCTYSDDKVTVEMVSSIAGVVDYEVDGFGNQAYRLTVEPESITIQAVDLDGVINAKATLAQLVHNCDGTIPCMEIVDWPSFKVRGWLLDIGRSYFSVEEIKREMDLLWRFKINYFHWHLTENQAWRMEIKAYPQLTAASSMTRDAGRYYTQAECREVVEYAKERGILVVPEIDMPGHSEAFTRAMGFTMASTQGQEALKVILGEVAEVFKESPYIHIGADETSVTAAFVKTMSDRVRELGKKCVTWNPISVAVTPDNGIDACQLWSTNGNYARGMVNIDSKYNYVNLHDMFADLVGVFNSNVYKQADGSSDLTGGVACLWTDRRLHSNATASAVSEEKEYIKHNNFYALMLANAERLWVGGRTKYIEQGGTRLANEGAEYDRFVDWENRFLHYKATWLKDEPVPYVRQSNIRWNLTVDGTSQVVTGAGAYLRHAWHPNIPGIVANPQPGMEAVAWTYIYSDKEQDAGAIIEFQTYERSWHDQAPTAGMWDKRGSRVWLNGTEIKAPAWTNAGQNSTFETLMTNENWTMRDPVAIHLQQGWNKVLIRMPYANLNTGQIRLNRWMWNFVVTDAQGSNALDGITYSAEEQTEYVDPTGGNGQWGEPKNYQVATTPTVWSSVEAGKWYKFQHGGQLPTYFMSSNGAYMLGVTGVALNESSVWTLESVAGGYRIKNDNGEYIAGSTTTTAKYWVGMTTEASQAAVFTLAQGNANANNCLLTIVTPPASGFAYLHFDSTNNGGVSNCGFYHDANGQNSQFQLFEVTVEETEPGTEPGTDPGTEPAVPDDNHLFKADKTYVIHRNGNTSAYMYANSDKMQTASLTESNKAFFWVLEPTEKKDCYYIKNMRTGQYVQSAKSAGLSNVVSMGNTPVEYIIGQDKTPGAATNNAKYYYLASTDNGTIQTSSDGPLGLNFGSNGVVGYYIKSGRGNSYWEIEEREPVAPVPTVIVKPTLAKHLGMVRIPCSMRAAWLSAMSIADYAYSATQAPSSAYVNFRTTDFFTLTQGKTYTLDLTAAGTSVETDIHVFVDWNNDGVYEGIDANAGTVTLTVPADAAPADTYMRVRITDNGLLGMDDDVEGTVYDFRMRVEAATVTPDAVASLPCSARQPLATFTLDGRRVHNPKHPGVYIINGKKYIVK